jgi:hypothetical protein
MAASRIEIASPHAPAECAARITAAIDVERSDVWLTTAIHGTHAVIGYAENNKLRLRRRIPFSNFFQPHLTGTLDALGNGTSLKGEVAMHGGGRVFCWVAGAGILFFCGVALLASVLNLMRGMSGPQLWWGFALLPIAVGMGMALRAWQRHIHERDRAALEAFLCEHLK